MEMNKLRKEKGVAGLEILISLIATLFVVGVLVMAFTIAGSKMAETVSEDTTGTNFNETLATVGDAGDYLTLYTTYGSSCSIVRVTNETDGAPITSGNYTNTGTGNWFDTFIVIGAIVVLVLLIILVIIAIRRAGLMGGESGA